MRNLLALLLLTISNFLCSQVTFKIVDLPTDTPRDAKIFMASSLNNWNPGDEHFQFEKDETGTYFLFLKDVKIDFEYKLTQGSWEKAEGDINGNGLQNRKFSYSISKNSDKLSILSWQKVEKKKNTQAENVTLLSENFSIPQLHTTRKIWIYLPPDYATSNKKYPVVYMQDAQNLFNEATSFSGEWQVDESLNKLFLAAKKTAIVIGIENGGEERLNEYSPWTNSKYCGGKGDLYADFLAKTLKPYVDKHYRTLPQAKNTGLIGSSMGGLISFYTGLKYPNTFGRLGVFSPSLWFAPKELSLYLHKNAKKLKHSKIYFLAGEKESEDMVNDVLKTEIVLKKAAVPTKNIRTQFDADGTHSESYWSREFGQAFEWLFAD